MNRRRPAERSPRLARPTYRRAGWRAGLLVAALAVTVGCGAGIAAKSDRSEHDARLTAQVKIALVQAPSLAAAAIDVTASDGSVVLRGFVETETQRIQAQQVAAGVDGVLGVDNRLTVK